MLAEANTHFEYTQKLRRDFHRHPELGFHEVRTAGIVAHELNELNLEVTKGIAETGVVAVIEGVQPGPVVLVRFDMDALPIKEQTGAEYASENEGVMHACGHDGHTAIGLTVAKMLTNHKVELKGTIKLVFQPGEEGCGGARRMVEEGVLENPKPDYSLALHLWNENPLGEISVTSGVVLAAAESFTIKITGKSAHGAQPHHSVDPVLATAQVITALQGIVSRNISPLEGAVISATMIRGGDAVNVIPSDVEIRGTIRSYLPEVRERILERFHQVVDGVAGAMECAAEIEIAEMTPAVINDPKLAKQVGRLAKEILPNDILNTKDRKMVSEDMAYMMDDIPGCYFFIGSSNPQAGLDANHHHPKFDFDEQAMPKAAALMVAAAMDLSKG